MTMKVWAMGLALCLCGHTASAQDYDVGYCDGNFMLNEALRTRDPHNPDLVRPGFHATRDEALAEGARLTRMQSTDIDGDGREEELLVVRPRADPYPYDRSEGLVIARHEAAGWTAAVIFRVVCTGGPVETTGMPTVDRCFEWGPSRTVRSRATPIVIAHWYHDRDPHGSWCSLTIPVHLRSDGSWEPAMAPAQAPRRRR